jgi:hypothetical protein
MRNVAGWATALAGVLVLAGIVASRMEAGTPHAAPTVTVYKSPT